MTTPVGAEVRLFRSSLPFEAVLAWALWVTAILLWGASSELVQTTQSLALSSASVAAAAWGAAMVIARPERVGRSWLRLGPLMLGYGGLTFGLATVTAWLAPETLQRNVDVECFRQAQALVILAFMAFTVGYRIGRRGRLHRLIVGGFLRVDTWSAARRLRAPSALLTYMLGFSALVAGAITSRNYGYLGDNMIASSSDVAWYTQPLMILSSLRGFAILALWVDVFDGRRSRLALALGLTTLDLTAGLFSGMKEAPVVTMLAVGLAYVHVKRRLPVLGALGVWTGFVLVLAPLVNAIRATVRGRSTLTLQEAVIAVAAILSQGGQEAQETIWPAVARFRLIDNVAIIAQKTPSEIPFEPVWDLIVLPLTGFIPRAIWPSKPLRMEGLAFYQQYYGGSTFSSSAVTVPGSLYMYGGVLVLVTGMLLFGTLTRVLDDGMRADESRAGLLLMLALFPSFIKMEASMPTLLASLPIEVVGWLLATWLLHRSAGSARSRAPA